MTFTLVEQNEDKTYSIKYSPKFYELFAPYYEGDSYHNVLYRLFGLLPQDFYHMVGAQYNAKFKPSITINTNIYTLFDKKTDAIAFANEIDRRITYIKSKIQ